MTKDVTMHDIAKELGVSTATVSKALNNKEGVGDTMRVAIRNKASEMGYQFAFMNKEGASRTVGVLVDALYVAMDSAKSRSPFYLRLYQNIVLMFARNGCSSILEIITDEMLAKRIQPKILSGSKVDSVMVMGSIRKNYPDLLRDIGLPTVYLDFYDENGEIPSVVTDNVYGTYLLTCHLIEKGHRKIAFLGSVDATSSILDRYLGYYRALRVYHIVPREDYLIPDRDVNGLFIDFELPLWDMPTAFVCNCDDIGYSLIERLGQEGYCVPQDISVVGFDNYTYMGAASPRLTTIEVDIEGMAGRAVEMIVGMMRGGVWSGDRITVSGRMVQGDSVAEIE